MAPDDGDDVQNAHEDRQRISVTHFERDEDDEAAKAQDQHQAALAQKPLAHTGICAQQGLV